MVEDKYGPYFGGQPHHCIDAFLKSDYQHTYETFIEEIGATLCNHVRKPGDIQRCIYTYAPLARKRAHVKYVTRKESFKISIHLDIHYRKFRKYNPKFFCMNDSERAEDSDRLRSTVFLEDRFPKKSAFER